jgi:subtilisin-like proprotein convertase family protein
VGVGNNASRSFVDNFTVQVLPPELTLEETEDFVDGVADRFIGDSTGLWQIAGADLYEGTPGAGEDEAISLIDFGKALHFASYVELGATLSTDAVAGMVFDYYAASDYKFVAIDVANQQVVLGHRSPKHGSVVDVAVDRALAPGADHDLQVKLKGAGVSVILNGQLVISSAFNSTSVDGELGVFTRGGSGSFDTVTFGTDDPGFEGLGGPGGGGNAEPVAIDDVATTDRDEAVVIAVLANDFDADGDSLLIAAWTQPDNGLVVVNPDGTITYTPNGGFTGIASFTYQVSDGTGQSLPASVTVDVLAPDPGPATYTNETPVTIGDNATVTSTIDVGDSYLVGDVNVRIDVSHQRVSDLQIFLHGANGTVIELFNRFGGNGDDLDNTVFDDDAAVGIASASAPYAGVFRPSGDLGLLAGQYVTGTWTLEIRDNRSGFTGTLHSWALIAESAASQFAPLLAGGESSPPDNAGAGQETGTLAQIIDVALAEDASVTATSIAGVALAEGTAGPDDIVIGELDAAATGWTSDTAVEVGLSMLVRRGGGFPLSPAVRADLTIDGAEALGLELIAIPAGDTNLDGVVNDVDLVHAWMDQGRAAAEAARGSDVDGNGLIDAADLELVRDRYLRVASGSATEGDHVLLRATGEVAAASLSNVTVTLHDGSGLRMQRALDLVVDPAPAGSLPAAGLWQPGGRDPFGSGGGINQIAVRFTDNVPVLGIHSGQLTGSDGNVIRNASFTVDGSGSVWTFEESLKTGLYRFDIDLDGDGTIDDVIEFAILRDGLS